MLATVDAFSLHESSGAGASAPAPGRCAVAEAPHGSNEPQQLELGEHSIGAQRAFHATQRRGS